MYLVDTYTTLIDKWIKDSLQSNILHEPLLSEQQQLFKPWDYSIDLASQPEFSVLNKFASMDLKRGRHFVTKCSDTELEMLITDVRKLQNLWMEVGKGGCVVDV
eukprot:923072-Amorphochlora_amoeboformis.AAC.1